MCSKRKPETEVILRAMSNYNGFIIQLKCNIEGHIEPWYNYYPTTIRIIFRVMYNYNMLTIQLLLCGGGGYPWVPVCLDVAGRLRGIQGLPETYHQGPGSTSLYWVLRGTSDPYNGLSQWEFKGIPKG